MREVCGRGVKEDDVDIPGDGGASGKGWEGGGGNKFGWFLVTFLSMFGAAGKNVPGESAAEP